MANIFVIDDDQQLLSLIGMMLERADHTPTLLDGPRGALERLAEALPDLLVLDVMMPGTSGHELCRQIRAMPELATLPILILTARAQAVDREAALHSGADDYLSKPVTASELVGRIDALLGNQAGAANGNQRPIVSFFGLRGGSGRTTLAVNLAAALQRLLQQDVALIDLSPSVSQVVYHLRLQPSGSWDDLPDNGSVSWEAIEARLVDHSSGLRVLPAPLQPVSPEALTMSRVRSLIQGCQERMAFTVFDLPALITPAITAVLQASDLVLHVVNPEVIAVQTALQSNRVLDNVSPALKQSVFVLNQTMPDAQLPVAAVERGLNSRVVFQLPYDPLAGRALAQGTPLVLSTIDSAFASKVRSIAGALQRRLAPVMKA